MTFYRVDLIDVVGREQPVIVSHYLSKALADARAKVLNDKLNALWRARTGSDLDSPDQATVTELQTED